jgi:hypothetical protein
MRRTLSLACASILSIALWTALPSAAHAASPVPEDPTADPLMLSAGFLSGHPDLRFRLLAQEEVEDGNHADAFRFFRRAAWYGDKPSQAMIAEMLWTGRGVEADRPAAYAWMDLSAERGYVEFVRFRERYWEALDASERERAIALGEAIYAEYGDAAATPRLEQVLRQKRRRMTGSRTGFAGNLQIHVPGPGGSISIPAHRFFDETYWDPERYRAWQDSIWSRPRTGTVRVGEVENARTPDSRVPATTPRVDAPEPDVPERDETGLGVEPPAY